MTEPTDAFDARLAPLASAYLPGALVAAAVELGLFERLTAPAAPEEVAASVGASVEGTARMLRALAALGVVRQTDEGRFDCPHHEALRADRPESVGALFLHHHRHVAPLFARLADSVRTGAPQHGAWSFASAPPASTAYEELARHPEEVALFLRAMDRDGRGVGERIASAVDLRGCDRLLDLGGGGGAIARGLLRAVPGLVVESVDLGPACAYARERSEAQGLGPRHRVFDRDLRRPLQLEPAPCVLLSAVLADFPPDERVAVMRNAAACVADGGTLLISERLLHDDRAGPVGAAMLSLLTFAAFGGDQLSVGDATELLAQVGFGVVALCSAQEGERDLLVAERIDSPRDA